MERLCFDEAVYAVATGTGLRRRSLKALHENNLRIAIMSTAADKALKRFAAERSGKDLLLGYYLGKNAHPYDEKRPISEWEKYE